MRCFIPVKEGYTEEIELLADLVPAAKKMNHVRRQPVTVAPARQTLPSITVDTPTPYRISELLGLIDKSLGGLDSTRNTGPYKRLRNRISTISQDARYGFMFGSLTVQDNLTEFLEPDCSAFQWKASPVSIIELGGLPT